MDANAVIVMEDNTMPGTRRSLAGWEPRVTFRDLVRIMMDADLEAAGVAAPGKGAHGLSEGQPAWLTKP